MTSIDQNEITPVSISNLISNQFPAFYREQGPVFIAFVKAYYEWLESPSNPLYYARRYYALTDIDTTLDSFIVFFKEKYLKNIQLDTQSDTRLLVKHALDIYRSKGTERCVRLLFQLVFNESIRFYYPSQDLFKLSDGHWFVPQYLELTLAESNVNLKGKEVVGIFSGARAYVEEVIRRRTAGHLQDVAYISAIFGEFTTNEKIVPADGSLDISLCPFMTGSLTEVLISPLGSGNSYTIGDIVDIESNDGEGGVGRVTAITQQFGLVTYNLEDGGYGFAANANVYVSNVALDLGIVNITATNATSYASWREIFTQNTAFINYRSATGILQNGDGITTYFGNGSVMGTGIILNKTQANTSSGVILTQIVSGNLQNTFYTTGNAIQANLTVSNGYFDVTAQGTFIANGEEVTLTVNNTSGFILNEFVRQAGTQGILTGIEGANLIIDKISGMFRNGLPLSGQQSGAYATPNTIAFSIGLINTSNTFFSFANNIVRSNTITATILAKDDAGSGLSVTVSNNLLLTENVSYVNTPLQAFLATALNATAYGLPGNATANLTNTVISNTVTYANLTIGKIQTLIQGGGGENYTHTPFIVAHQPQTYQTALSDTILDISSVDAAPFIAGELVTQAATNARGTVQRFSNSSVVYLQRNRFYSNQQFIVTSNVTTQIIGGTSGLTANVRIVSVNASGTPLMGHNMMVETSFFVGNGALLTVDVIDSGFGYVEGGQVHLVSETANGAVGNAHLVTTGHGRGFYHTKGGFLSDDKKLFDGDFYQNYSYQIISRLMLNKYQDLLKNITHPAGTKMFGRLVLSGADGLAADVSKVMITTS